MSLEYDVIEDVKNVQQDKDDDDDEIEVASENTLQSLRCFINILINLL